MTQTTPTVHHKKAIARTGRNDSNFVTIALSPGSRYLLGKTVEIQSRDPGVMFMRLSEVANRCQVTLDFAGNLESLRLVLGDATPGTRKVPVVITSAEGRFAPVRFELEVEVEPGFIAWTDPPAASSEPALTPPQAASPPLVMSLPPPTPAAHEPIEPPYSDSPTGPAQFVMAGGDAGGDMDHQGPVGHDPDVTITLGDGNRVRPPPVPDEPEAVAVEGDLDEDEELELDDTSEPPPAARSAPILREPETLRADVEAEYLAERREVERKRHLKWFGISAAAAFVAVVAAVVVVFGSRDSLPEPAQHLYRGCAEFVYEMMTEKPAPAPAPAPTPTPAAAPAAPTPTPAPDAAVGAIHELPAAVPDASVGAIHELPAAVPDADQAKAEAEAAAEAKAKAEAMAKAKAEEKAKAEAESRTKAEAEAKAKAEEAARKAAKPPYDPSKPPAEGGCSMNMIDAFGTRTITYWSCANQKAACYVCPITGSRGTVFYISPTGCQKGKLSGGDFSACKVK